MTEETTHTPATKRTARRDARREETKLWRGNPGGAINGSRAIPGKQRIRFRRGWPFTSRKKASK